MLELRGHCLGSLLVVPAPAPSRLALLLSNVRSDPALLNLLHTGR
jgi:hypothetical protein